MIGRCNRALSLCGALVGIVLGPSGASRAGEVCLEPLPHSGCQPCDLPIEMQWVGYSTEGPPCQSPPSDLTGRVRSDESSDAERGWWTSFVTLSASASDPWVNTGPLPAAGELSLWLVDAGCGYGFSFIQIDVSGDLTIQAYVPVAPGRHTWIPSPGRRGGTFRFSVNCWGGCYYYPDCPPSVIGTFLVSEIRHESRPFDADTWSGVKTRWRPTDPSP